MTTEADKAKIDKKKREETREAMQAEEDARNAVAVSTDSAKPAAVVPMSNVAKAAMPRHRQIVSTAYNTHAIECPGMSLAEFLALQIDEGAEKRYLYTLIKYFKRYDLLVLYDEPRSWEVHARLMKIDTELQTVHLSPIHIVEHNLVATARVKLGDITVLHLGDALKWCVLHGKTRLKTGFDSKVEAEQWLSRYKAAAVADGKAA